MMTGKALIIENEEKIKTKKGNAMGAQKIGSAKEKHRSASKQQGSPWLAHKTPRKIAYGSPATIAYGSKPGFAPTEAALPMLTKRKDCFAHKTDSFNVDKKDWPCPSPRPQASSMLTKMGGATPDKHSVPMLTKRTKYLSADFLSSSQNNMHNENKGEIK